MPARKSLSKRLRFEVFKRDGFTCVYCGATPLQGPLHIDHVEPVASGGTSEPHNLVTACDNCNSGKGAVPLDKKSLKSRLTGPDKDQRDQILEYLAEQKRIGEAKNQACKFFAKTWEGIVGPMSQDFYDHNVKSLLQEWPIEALHEAMEITARKYGTASDDVFIPHVARTQVKYFYGILRHWREGIGAPKTS